VALNRLFFFKQNGAGSLGLQTSIHLGQRSELTCALAYEYQQAVSELPFGPMAINQEAVLHQHFLTLPLMVEMASAKRPALYLGLGVQTLYQVGSSLKITGQELFQLGLPEVTDPQRLQLGPLVSVGYKFKVRKADQLKVELRSRLLTGPPGSITSNEFMLGTFLNLTYLFTKKT